MKKDYYEILGLNKDASKDDIEKAYRKLALKYHPDRNQDDPSSAEKFREVTTAYEVLGDPDKRSQYDQFGFASDEDGGAPHYQYQNIDLDDALRMFMRSFGGGFGSFFGGDDNFSDMFGGRGGGRRGPMKGDDRVEHVRITLEEAAKGVERELEIKRLILCPDCGGTGSVEGGEPETCPECHGSGSMRMVKNLGPVQYVTTRSCTRCHGEGSIIKDPCKTCRGKKKVRKTAKKTIEIPKGVDHGNRLLVAGMGDAGEKGAPPGDLLIVVEVRPHPFFQRMGNDLRAEITVNYPQLVLGSKVQIPSLDGNLEFKIPSGTAAGEVLRIKGSGMPQFNYPKRKGDLFVQVNVDIPKHPSMKEKRAIKKLLEIQGEAKNFNK